MARVFIGFTVAALEKLPNSDKGIAIYKDRNSPFLSLYVTTKGVKTFFVRKRVLGRDERLVLGRFPVMTIEQARKKALLYCSTVADRKDPKAEQRNQDRKNLTFGNHFQEYFERYSKVNKKTWKDDKRDIDKYLSHWFRRRLADITKPEIQRLHEQIGRNNGRYQANRILQRIRAIYNKAIEWGWSGSNPTAGIKKFKEQSRDRFIRPHEMPYFIQALTDEHDDNVHDYFKLLLYTGTRKTNMLTMQWKDILWHESEWHIEETKNGDPLAIPLVPEAMTLLKDRYENSESAWVFSSCRDRNIHMKCPRAAWKHIIARATLYAWADCDKVGSWVKSKQNNGQTEIIQVTELQRQAQHEKIILPPCMTDIRIHDIRRTFGSYQAITGASLTIIGKSLGHRSSQSTQVYARLHLDPVRASIEKATSAMFDPVM